MWVGSNELRRRKRRYSPNSPTNFHLPPAPGGRPCRHKNRCRHGRAEALGRPLKYCRLTPAEFQVR